MPRRLPILATLLVALAVATMIGLGVWQLQRATWKEDLLARYETNRGLPAVVYPTDPKAAAQLLYRRAVGVCVDPFDVQVTAGRDAAETSGWGHVASCRGGEGAPPMTVDIGWSAAFDAPVTWRGGPVEGVLAPDSKTVVRLVAATPAPGLVASAPPGTDAISNNHRFYAAQWFFFASVAALIYAIALRQRRRRRIGDTVQA